jgi:hypothetical protein
LPVWLGPQRQGGGAGQSQEACFMGVSPLRRQLRSHAPILILCAYQISSFGSSGLGADAAWA